MTITIPDTLASDIVAAFGQAAARAHDDQLANIYRERANTFISALEPNAQEPSRWLLNEAIKIWSPQ